jgi:thymidylate synthase (FAD)
VSENKIICTGMLSRGSKWSVLDDGFIQFVDYMGDESDICQAARVSYGKGTKSISDDINLIRYLMRHLHTSPFEQCEIKLYVRMPLDVMRQWVRHRTMSMNEYSTRYSEAIDSQQKTDPDKWRLQSGANKQGSSGFLTEWPLPGPEMPDESPGKYLSQSESDLIGYSRLIYEERLKFGVAREQARKDLPLSTYTEAFIKFDLHNLLHFLRLRMDSHAQLEIRSYANIIGEQIVSQLWPITWEAFQDYWLQALSLTRLDCEIISTLNNKIFSNEESVARAVQEATNLGWLKYNHPTQTRLTGWYSLIKSREREECEAKLTRLGIDIPWANLGE